MRTTAERIAWGLVLVVFALTAIAVTVAAPYDSSLSEVSGGGLLVPAIAFPVLGALVIRQRGSHVIGWLLIGMAVSLAVEGCAEQWAQAALVDQPGSLPLGDFASWVQAWAWIPGWLLATTLLPAVFPEGRPRGRLRLLAWADGPDRRLADPRDRRGKLASPRPTAPHRGRLGSPGRDPQRHHGGRHRRDGPSHLRLVRHARGPTPPFGPGRPAPNRVGGLRRGRRCGHRARRHGIRSRRTVPRAPSGRTDGRRGCSDVALPALRHRRRDQPHARLRRAHRPSRGRLPRAACWCCNWC